MTHDEAFERLMELAGGNYCSLEYSTRGFKPGRTEHKISAYIENHDHVWGKTYAQVITGMEAQLGIGYQEPPEVEDDES